MGDRLGTQDAVDLFRCASISRSHHVSHSVSHIFNFLLSTFNQQLKTNNQQPITRNQQPETKNQQPTIWKPENLKTWKPENLKTWKPENLKTWKPENLKICHILIAFFLRALWWFEHSRTAGMGCVFRWMDFTTAKSSPMVDSRAENKTPTVLFKKTFANSHGRENFTWSETYSKVALS